jgi:agmatinase
MFIAKIPGINGENSKGCEKAGNAILESLKKIHSNEQGNIIDTNLLDLEEIHLDNSNLKLTNKLIYENSLETFETKPQVIFLGGDHSISYPTNKSFLQYCKNEKKKPCLIIFDAHVDCLKTGEFATDRNWVRKLIESGFPKENILIVGERTIEKEEIIFTKENKIKILSMAFLTEDLSEMCDTIMEFSSGKELYVSINIDVIDPIFAPSTPNPEPGGLTSRQFLYLIQRIKKIKTLKAIDIVNINEEKDKDKITIKLGAKILAELI